MYYLKKIDLNPIDLWLKSYSDGELNYRKTYAFDIYQGNVN